LFEKTTKLYVAEWEKEFGKEKYFLIDTFNEIKKFPIPEGGSFADAMKNYGGRLSSILAEADPDAVWTIQGWIFHYQRKIWTPKVVEALFSQVPNDKVLILDMMGSWEKYDGFRGKPWIDGFITNMGGKTPYTGAIRDYAASVSKLLKSDKKGRNVGLSNHSEGIETNAILFELIADLGWERDFDLDAWLKEYCRDRYGDTSGDTLAVWKTLLDTCYKRQRWNNHFSWQRLNPKKKNAAPHPKFEDAVKRFLSLRGKYGNSPFYVDDAVEMSALVLGQKADGFFRAANEALKLKDSNAYGKNLEQAEKLLLAADRLLESHSLDRLERWTAFARSHAGGDAELADYYEENAKRIVTSWGPPVNDYSARVWSGLIRDFYVPRMKAWLEAKAAGKNFDRRAWEEKWLHTPGVSKIDPYPNPLDAAAKLLSEDNK
jgi:alpha-N-acetylglucosaminidase